MAQEPAEGFGFGSLFAEKRPAPDIFAETTHEEDLMSLAGIVARLEKRGHVIALDITSPSGKKKRLSYKTPAPAPENSTDQANAAAQSAGLLSEEQLTKRYRRGDRDGIVEW